MKNDPRGRIFEVDFLRGCALILMCLDHLCYDLYLLRFWFPAGGDGLEKLSRFGYAVSVSDWRLALHYVFAALFLLLAGVGSALSRHPWKRFGQIAGGAAAVTLVTVLLTLWFHADVTILFGVLSAMAVGALLCIPCRKKGGRWAALAAGILMIAAGFFLRWYAAPETYDLPADRWWEVAVGTLHFGADWFPIFPCCGVILVGFFVGQTWYASRQSLIPALRGKTCFLCAVGRYPLWIYLLHQPVIGGLVYGAGWLLRQKA